MSETMYIPNPRIACVSPIPCPDPCDTRAVNLKRQTQCLPCIPDVTDVPDVEPPPTGGCTPQTSRDLIAYWTFQETGDYWNDVVGGRELNDAGGVDVVAGKSGNALSFSGGSNSYAEAGPDAQMALFNTDFSIRFWLKPGSTQPALDSYILARFDDTESGWSVSIDSNLSVRVVFWNGGQSIASTPSLTANSWAHVVVAFVAATRNLKVWVNVAGVIDSTFFFGPGNGSGVPLRMGTTSATLYPGRGNYVGALDEVLISTYAWNQCDVTYDYNGGTGKFWPL